MQSVRSLEASAFTRAAAILSNIITQKLYDLPADYWALTPESCGNNAEYIQNTREIIDLDHLQLGLRRCLEALTTAKYGKVKSTTLGQAVPHCVKEFRSFEFQVPSFEGDKGHNADSKPIPDHDFGLELETRTQNTTYDYDYGERSS